MRIGVVHWAFPPVIGGVEMHLLTICPEMVRQGADVFLLCGSEPETPECETIQGVSVHRTPGMDPVRIEEARAEGQDIYENSRHMFESFLDRNELDVVQAHNLHLDFYHLSRALQDACRQRGVPFYLVIHNDVFIDRSEQRTWRIVKEIAWDKLVPISDYVKQTMASRAPEIPQDRWVVIKHGIDAERFSPPSAEERQQLRQEYGFAGREVILHPARFLPWKGILPALHALSRVRNGFPTALMVMTGRAARVYKDPEELIAYDHQIDRYIEEQDLQRNVHIGDYDHEDIPRLITLSDIVIYTTIGDEPFGLVPLEGMACEVPVVVTKSGGLVESVIDGKTGFIISKDEEKLPVELADRIAELLSNPDLARRMGKKGRERVEKMFSKSRMAKDFLQLSEQLTHQ